MSTLMFTSAVLWLSFFAAAATKPAAAMVPGGNRPPAGFVALRDAVPGIRLDMRYHTAQNFTGAPLPGYGAAEAWLLLAPAQALERVQGALAADGQSLLVYDAYRPVRATLAMVAWAQRTGNLALFRDGYIASKSGHNHGHTVDLTICDKESGAPIDMGTPWDTLSTESNTLAAKGKALDNRLRLKAAMEAAGFRPYAKEWWHFGYPVPGSKPRDVPYGCFEAPENEFTPPAGWNVLGFVMPASFPTAACRE